MAMAANCGANRWTPWAISGLPAKRHERTLLDAAHAPVRAARQPQSRDVAFVRHGVWVKTSPSLRATCMT